VQVGGRGIDAICALSVREAFTFLGGLAFEETDRTVAAKVLFELKRRLSYLTDVGLDYLTLDRAFASLSGGEAQRIALATALGTGWWARSTCSTSRPSASIPATRAG
jgi:excinuclease ABC subunit A